VGAASGNRVVIRSFNALLRRPPLEKDTYRVRAGAVTKQPLQSKKLLVDYMK